MCLEDFGIYAQNWLSILGTTSIIIIGGGGVYLTFS